jgi:hypothetical protein
MKKAILFSLLILYSVAATAQPSIQWGAADISELMHQAEVLQALDEKPEALTMVLSDIEITIEKDVVRKRVRDIWYYPSIADAHNSGMDRIAFNKQKDSLTIHAAASIDRRGKVRMFDPQRLRITDVHQDNIFTDTREAVVALPGIGPGSLTLLDYEIVTDRAMMETPWSALIYPTGLSPVLHFRLTVRWPGAQHHPTCTSGGSSVTCRSQPEAFTCEGRDLPAPKPDRDVLWADQLEQIIVSEAANWNQVIEVSLTAFHKAMVDIGGADHLLQEISETNISTSEKISQLHDFVARDIRYISMSEHGNTITPHSIASVLAERYGDCKDKSAVLYYFLRHLGLDAYPVLVATNRHSANRLELPSTRYFNHMVICFEWEGGNYCLDPTDSYTDWQHIPAAIQGKVALELRPDSKPSVIRSNQYRWRLKTHTDIALSPEGGQHERQERIFHGEYAGTFRNFLAGMSKTERVRWAVEDYHTKLSDMATPSFSFEGIDRLVPELVIRSRADYEPIVDPNADLDYTEEDTWLIGEIASLQLEKRHYDDYFPGLEVSSHFKFDVSEHWMLTTLTPELDLEHPLGQMTRSVTHLDDRRFVVDTSLRIPEQKVSKENIAAFNDFLDLLTRESKIRFRAKLRH